MKLETAKGMKDSLPDEEIIKQKIIRTLTTIFELYGFSPMDTPAIEKFDVLSSKYAGGEDILKETFKLTDQGNRTLGLRYDLTVPFSRVIGMNPKMKMPFKRYQIGKVWRDGPIGKARYREFWQCDVDVVGGKEMAYDAEILLLASRFFKEIGLQASIRVNSVKILHDIMAHVGIDKKIHKDVLLTIDKLDKFGEETVKKELKEKGINTGMITDLLMIIRPPVANKETLLRLEEIIPASDGLKEIREVLAGFPDAILDASLARGLSYYTGTIFEIYIKGSDVTSAICAGGRYDHLIGKILGSGDFPAVGISFGLSRIYDALKEKSRRTVTDLYIIPIGTDCRIIAEKIRDMGIRTEIDLSGRGPSKNMKYANSLGIPYVAFIGPDELDSGTVKLKDMKNGTETVITAEKLPGIISQQKAF